MNVFIFFKSLFLSFIEFFKAYDQVSKVVDGFPILKGWNQNDNIYQKLYNSVKKKSIESPICSLLFEELDRSDNLVLLSEGEYQVGNHCHSDIVVTSSAPVDRSVILVVSHLKVTYDCIDEVTKSAVNGVSGGNFELIEQDRCQFNNIRFTYLRP